MFSKKATKIDEIFTVDLTMYALVSVKLTVKSLSISVAFLENMNFNFIWIQKAFFKFQTAKVADMHINIFL